MSIHIGFVIVGILLIVLSFWNHCLKRLSIDYAVSWGLLGFSLIVVNAIPAFLENFNNLEGNSKGNFFFLSVLFLFWGLHESIAISQLSSKIKELTIGVAILDKENEALKIEIDKLTNLKERNTDVKKNSVCH